MASTYDPQARFLRTPEAGRFLGLSGRTLEKHRTYGSLPAFAQQSGQQLLYPSSLVAGRTSPPLAGEYTAEAALAVLLRDTGLAYRRTRPKMAERRAASVSLTSIERPMA